MTMRPILLLCLLAASASALSTTPSSPQQRTSSPPSSFSPPSSSSRRAFLSAAAAAVPFAAVASASSLPAAAIAAKTPEILNTPKGVKYAVTKAAPDGAARPMQGDIVAIEYTGYLTSGQIFDATHSEGKKNALLFKLGDEGPGVIPGLNDIVSQMSVGQKVQAIVPPSMAYGDKGVCLESGECLIEPGSTLVYDVLLKKSSIPPP